jgi:TRAP-type C4-dicarboxylate transport system permease small subunit
VKDTSSLDRLAARLTELFNWVCMAAIALMLAVSVVDIVGTRFFSWPVPGSIDFIGLLLLLISAYGVSKTELMKRHIRVDSLTVHLSPRSQHFCDAFSAVFSFVLWAVVVGSSVKYGIMLYGSKEGSATLLIPLFPFVLAMSLGCLPILLVIVAQFIRAICAIKSGS